MDALYHNKPPTEGTLRSIAAIRRNPESLVAASIERRKCISREIKQLQEEKERLSNVEKVRATIRSACDAASAPIRRLPLDVIREIAVFALDEHPSVSSKSSPMTLSRVCSAWRYVVLSSPRLWSTLYLTINTVDQDSIVRHAGTVQNWFQRACGAPKRFFLYVACPIATGTPSYHFHLFLKAIGPSLSGLRCLGIGSKNWPNLMAQFVDVTWDVSNLESVELLGQVANRDNSRLDHEMAKLASLADRITLFKKAKNLAKVVALQELWAFPLASAFLPWQQIVDISLQECRHIQICVIDTLRNAPQLRTARLYCGLLQREGSAPLVHRNLERLTLHITKSSAHNLLTFLSNCTFPNLKETRFASFENVNILQPTDLIPTINTLPSLEILILGKDIRIPTNHLLSLLRSAPNLRTLSMHAAGSDGRFTDLNEVFASMTIEEGHCKILPRLEQCVFYGAPETPGTKFFLDASLVSCFIHSRFEDLPEGCSRLKAVKLMGCFHFLASLQDEVGRLSQGKNQIPISVGRGNIDDISVSETLLFQVPFGASFVKFVCHDMHLA